MASAAKIAHVMIVPLLSALPGLPAYDFIDPGLAPVGTDEIAVGLIYQPATVMPVGAAAILDDSGDPTFLSNYNRPAIAQTFERTTGAEPSMSPAPSCSPGAHSW